MSLQRLLDVPAPAKLNLFLHVVGRRPDGYHRLQSVFMLIDWADTLHFERRRDGRISREDLLGQPLPEQDLVVRAAQALQHASATPWGAHIGLLKTLPMEAGLGGGSSDAASTLIALNRLWGLNWPLERLMRLGEPLGADVPFFLGGTNAWVEGIGEQLTPMDLPAAAFAVVKPTAGVSTPALFRDPALRRDSPLVTMRAFADSQNPWGFGRNDLEPVARRLCPQVGQALDWLQSQGLEPRMTGSGSAVFAPCTQPIDLTGLPIGWHGRICKNLNEHPLKAWQSGL